MLTLYWLYQQGGYHRLYVGEATVYESIMPASQPASMGGVLRLLPFPPPPAPPSIIRTWRTERLLTGLGAESTDGSCSWAGSCAQSGADRVIIGWAYLLGRCVICGVPGEVGPGSDWARGCQETTGGGVSPYRGAGHTSRCDYTDSNPITSPPGLQRWAKHINIGQLEA